MPESIDYTVRRSALEAERTWRVDDMGLSWTDPSRPGQFPFKDIVEIRLQWLGSRADLARYACHVRRFNGWTETIVSTHYDGPMQFPDRSKAYIPFVGALIHRTSAANPACRFRAGSSSAAYFGNLVAMLAGLGLLLLVMVSIGAVFPWLIVVKLIIIAVLALLAIRWLKVNRPRSFDPGAIPASVLPSPS